MKTIILFFACVFIVSFQVLAVPTKEEMNKANNPLTPMLGVNLQDYITSSIFGTDKTSNSFLLRGTLPHKTGGLPQITRLTVPYVSVPSLNENVTGLGDVNIFDIFLFKPVNGIEFGVGPYFILPTASKKETGTDKWQAGASGVVIKSAPWGVVGALLTYQHDFAGPSENATQNIATAQPLLIYNLPHTLYLRSSSVWNYNLANGDYYVPVGMGLGKIWKLKSGTVVNIFAEPQWTLFHEGDGSPNFQTFVGINFQFPL